jgi:hypothetical protein
MGHLVDRESFSTYRNVSCFDCTQLCGTECTFGAANFDGRVPPAVGLGHARNGVSGIPDRSDFLRSKRGGEHKNAPLRARELHTAPWIVCGYMGATRGFGLGFTKKKKKKKKKNQFC